MDITLQIYGTIFQNQQLLLKPEEYFYSILKDHIGFMRESIKLILNEQVPQKKRTLISSTLKGLILMHWQSLLVSEIEKREIRGILRNAFLQSKIKPENAENISIIICEIVNIEGFSQFESVFYDWTCFVETSEDYESCMTLIDILLRVFEKTDDRAHVLVKYIIEFAYKTFTSNEADLSGRYRILMLVYLAFKSLNWCETSDPQTLKNALRESVSIWNGIFVMVLSSQSPSFNVLKFYVLRTLTEIFREMKSVSREIVTAIYPQIWKSFIISTKVYLDTVIFSENNIQIDKIQQSNLPEKEKIKLMQSVDFENEVLGFSNFNIELQETCLLDSTLEAVLIAFSDLMVSLTYFSELNEITRNTLAFSIWTLSHLLLIPANDQMAWMSDPNLYIYEDDDECNPACLKQAALNAISNYIEKFQDQAIEIIIDLIDFFTAKTQNSLQEKLKVTLEMFSKNKIDFKVLGFNPIYWSNNDPLKFEKTGLSWKFEESGLLLLGNFVQDIVSFMSQKKNFDENEFAGNITKIIKTKNHVIVVGRALWALNCLSYLPKVDEGLLLQIFFMLGEHLQPGHPLSLRFCASKSMTILSYKIAVRKLKNNFKLFLGNQIAPFFKVVLELANHADENTLGLVLDNLLSFYDINPEILAEQINKQVCVFLLKMLNQNFDHVIVSTSLLELFKRFLSVKKTSDVFFPVFSIFMSEFLQNYVPDFKKEDRFCKILDILIFSSLNCVDYTSFASLLTKISQITTGTLNSNIINKSTILFKNLLFKCESLNLNLEQTGSEAKKLFLFIIPPYQPDTHSVYIGNLAFALYHRCPDSRSPDFVTAIARKLAKTALPSANQGIVVFFSYLLSLNFQLTINFLLNLQIDAKFGLKLLFDHWLLHQPKFIGPRTKHLTLMTLSSIYFSNLPALENCFVVGFKPSHKSKSPEVKLSLKILSTLALTLKHEKKRLRKIANKALDCEQRVLLYEQNLMEGGRMDTEFEEQDNEDGSKNSQNDVINVDINIQVSDDEDEVGVPIKGGLAKIETGSQSYMSGLLGFDEDDNDECDESTEADLEAIGIPNIDLIVFLEDILKRIVNGPWYQSQKILLDQTSQEILKELE